MYNLFSNRDILKLVLPLFVEQCLFMCVGTMDTLMMASLGAASISAVSLAGMVIAFLASIFFALAAGGAVVVSQCIGASNLIRARENAKQLLCVALIAGLAVAIPTEVFLPQLVHLTYGHLEPDVYAATMTYFRITLITLPLISVRGACAALFRSMNQAKITMYAALGENLINLAGNALLIFVFSMGVAGAAWATVASRLFPMFMLLFMLCDRNRMIHVDFRSGFRISWQLIRKILYIGVPNGIENGIFDFGRVVLLGLIATFGTREIVANAIANTLGGFGCVSGTTFCLAVTTVVGQAVGAGKREQVRYYIWKMMKWACSFHFIWNLLLFCFTPLILSCFSRIDSDTRHLAWILILIHNGIGAVLWPMSFVFPNALRAMNDVRWTMVISITSMILIRIGLSYSLSGVYHSGVLAVWTAMICDWCVRITCFYLRYRSGAWCRLAHLHV